MTLICAYYSIKSQKSQVFKEVKVKKARKHSGTFIHRVSEFIVDKRLFIFLFVIAGMIFSAFSIGWVEVENDLTEFLPDGSSSQMGADVMFEEFTLTGMAQIMVANISLEDAWDLSKKIQEVDGVQIVVFGEDKAYYNNASACYTLIFDYPQSDPKCEASLDEIKAILSGHDAYISSDIGNPIGDILDEEITLMILVAGIIVIIMLMLTSKSLVEVPVILITFFAAMVLNMGTNFIYGKISFVSNSVTSLLQLALSLDYAVILINRYRDSSKRLPLRESVVEALEKSVPEVFGSSLTTVGGLAAMMCMQFKLGPDMGMCLIKAILFAMLSVFALMPGLLMIFGKAIIKTQHKSLIPNMSFIGKFAYKARKVITPLFVVIVIAAMLISSACPFSYGYTNQEAAKLNDQTMAKKMISQNFGATNMIALLVPSGDFEKEAALLKELESRDEVGSTMGIAGMELIDGYTLTDKLTPREFSELIDLDYEIATVIYAAYAASNEEYGSIINDISKYKVPLIHIVEFAVEQIDSGMIDLEGIDMSGIGDMAGMAGMGDVSSLLGNAKELLDTALSMTVGENYSRMVIYLNLPDDSDETFAFIEEMKSIASDYYDGANVYAVGMSTTSMDFKESFQMDNFIVTAVSIIIVLIVLLFSFKSIAMPIILILVIQGSIWINFSIPSIMETPIFFLGYTIISAIQMGANIDYAIVIATRYNELKHEMDQKQAIIETMNFAFPTVITSGTIMSSAALLIGYMSSEATISSLGINLGRGTIISIILVLFVLPSLLLVSDKLVDKTSFKLFKKKKKAEEIHDGRVYVSGRVSGEIHGVIDGEIDAVIDGNVNLNLLSGQINQGKEDEANEK